MPDPLDWLDDALADLDRRGLRRTLRTVKRIAPGNRIIDLGSELVNFGSNDYLGLACDPRVVTPRASPVYGVGWGAGASPLVTGHDNAHGYLERELAQFEGADSAIVFSTGYAANIGTIAALVGRGDAIYSDANNHASIIDGCRLSGAAVHVFRHRDIDHLRELLQNQTPSGRRLIVTDTLFSMDGDLAPLPALAELAAKHQAMFMVDEAHATGVFGEGGRGICEHCGVEEVVHVRVGTLSKALGSIGGFVAGSQQLIDWLSNRARTYVFSTAMPPLAAAASRQSLQLVIDEPDRRAVLLARAARLRDTLQREGFKIGSSQSQIIPIILGDAGRTMSAAAELRNLGFFVPGIRPPSVPEGQSLLRISVTYLHTDRQIDELIAALRIVCPPAG